MSLYWQFSIARPDSRSWRGFSNTYSVSTQLVARLSDNTPWAQQPWTLAFNRNFRSIMTDLKPYSVFPASQSQKTPDRYKAEYLLSFIESTVVTRSQYTDSGKQPNNVGPGKCERWSRSEIAPLDTYTSFYTFVLNCVLRAVIKCTAHQSITPCFDVSHTQFLLFSSKYCQITNVLQTGLISSKSLYLSFCLTAFSFRLAASQ